MAGAALGFGHSRHNRAITVLRTVGLVVLASCIAVQAIVQSSLPRIVSVAEVRLAEPRVEVHCHAADKASIALAKLELIAMHPRGIQGTAAAGLIAAFPAADRSFLRALPSPNVDAMRPPELARELAAPCLRRSVLTLDAASRKIARHNTVFFIGFG